jgi:hypothetical protein
MPKQEVAITISTNTEQAQASVKSFKAQLREANGELISMSEKFGAASTEAVNAAKKVAGLKDAIGDAKALAETFNPDKKFVALGGAIQGAVSGFSALQGASALFGSESKDLEKTLLKVQSVMALQQGISGIFGAIDSFKLLANTIKVNVVSAFSTMKTAIATTGLGLLVVAIGAVAAAFSSMADKAEEAAAATEKANKKALEYAEVGLKAEQEFIKQREKLDIAKAKAAGKTEDEIFLIQQKARASNIESLQRSYNEIKDLQSADAIERAALLKQQIKQINNEGQVAELDNQTRLNKIKEDADKKAKDKKDENIKKQLEELKTFNEKLKELEKKLNDELRAENAKTEEEKLQLQKQRDLDELNAIKLSETDKQETRRLIKEKYYIAEIDLANKRKQEQAEKDAKTLEDAAMQMQEEDYAETEKKKKKFNDTIELEKSTAKAIIEQKQAISDAEFNIASGAVNLLKMIAGKNEALQKVAVIADGAIGVAKIITSTMAANAAALATPQAIATSGLSAIPVIVRNKISAAIGIATTVAATAKALSALGGGGGAVGGGSLPGGSGGGASAPMLPQASSTTINQGQVNQIGNVAARAFVVESDVSGQQERIRRLNRAARIS